MNNKVPSFGQLYSTDYNIKSSVQMIFGSLLFQVIAYYGFEQQIVPPLVAILAALTVIGIIWLVTRYNLITSTFRDGITVTGKILDLETITSHSGKNNRRRYTYYGKFAYTVQGQPHEIRMRIADNPHLMGLKEGEDIELVLREEKPKTVFIKMLYLS
ncbi:MAG TPA: hypothetical protein PKJ84_11120 [Anaerolineales bacterium]|nr:hypothetical protein [Anaerolineales bacterium]HNO94715.1 hypothetical protein [Anaerolineales bacterium]